MNLFCTRNVCLSHDILSSSHGSRYSLMWPISSGASIRNKQQATQLLQRWIYKQWIPEIKEGQFSPNFLRIKLWIVAMQHWCHIAGHSTDHSEHLKVINKDVLMNQWWWKLSFWISEELKHFIICFYWLGLPPPLLRRHINVKFLRPSSELAKNTA